jgi:hypothetical protein
MNFVFPRWQAAALLIAAPALWAAENGAKLSNDQIEHFLQTAKVLGTKDVNVGVTNSQKAKLSDGTLTHDAHVQYIDEAKTVFQGDRGTEMNFRDTWKFNVAAYRLARILEIDMIPPSVERKVNGKSAAVTWWLDNSMMEVDRIKKKLESPDKDRWNREMYMVRVFDQLIYNTDRTLQNLMIDEDWRIWMIDHTRAFRLYMTLREKKDLVKCERALLEKLRTLNAEMLKPLKPYVNDGEIKGLLGRRDKIVQFFDAEVKQKGEAAVLYDRPPR